MQHHSFYRVSLSVILQINRGQLCGVPLMAHQVIMVRFVDHCDQNSLLGLLPDSRLRRLVYNQAVLITVVDKSHHDDLINHIKAPQS